ncbi:MAG TPA: SRPBCC domain-containing protein [Archangium sp.]|nr:SRPBCC domain-containing protein [Archangium sp.]
MTRTLQTHEIFIQTTPEKLWDAMTNAAVTPQYFFGTAVSSSFKPNEPIVYGFGPGGPKAVDGKVLEAQPGKKLVHTWTIHYDPTLIGESSRVSYDIEPRGEAVKLTVTHEMEKAPLTAKHLEKDGWSKVLSGLKTLLETGKPLVLPRQ